VNRARARDACGDGEESGDSSDDCDVSDDELFAGAAPGSSLLACAHPGRAIKTIATAGVRRAYRRINETADVVEIAIMGAV
jgi:hypothetical protein